MFVGPLGLVGIAGGRRRDWFGLTDAERDYLAFRRERAEFDEWITEAELPAARLDAAEDVVATTSLAGLVDLAIDSDRRVLESPAGDRYVVLDGDVVYTFEAPARPPNADPLAAGTADSTDEDGEEPTDDTAESATLTPADTPGTEATDGGGEEGSGTDGTPSI